MPPSRFSRLITGSRRTFCSAIVWTTSFRSSSSKQYFTAGLIASRTLASGPLPWATAPRDVAVGQHPDQPVALADRQHARVELGHPARGLLERVVRRREFDLPVMASLTFMSGPRVKFMEP